MTIGERIRIARKEQNLTQKELADRSGVAEISIRNYENGKRQPRVEQLRMLAMSLDVSPEYFITGASSSPNFTVFNWLESVGYSLKIYEEEEWRALILMEMATFKRYRIKDADVDELVLKLTSYTKFLVSEMIANAKPDE